MVRRFLKSIVRRLLSPVESSIVKALEQDARTSAATKIGQRQLYHHYRGLVAAGTPPRLEETGFRVFSQFEEDGTLLFIFAALGVSRGTFVDIGANDGIYSNCANLALNLGWRGLFIEGDPSNVHRGEAFYRQHPDTWAYPPKFVQAL